MKAIITDLDRTLLRTDKSVSEYTYAVLKKCRDRGIIIMAATARPERTVLSYHNRIGFAAITTLNGARVILPDGIIENGIAPSGAESILKNVITVPDLVLSMETGDDIFQMFQFPNGKPLFLTDFPRCLRKALYLNLF